MPSARPLNEGAAELTVLKKQLERELTCQMENYRKENSVLETCNVKQKENSDDDKAPDSCPFVISKS